MELREGMLLQEGQQSDVEVHRGLCEIMHTVPGSGRRGVHSSRMAARFRTELRLSQVVPRSGFSEILHLIWLLGIHPSAPAVVMCGDRIFIILPPRPVTNKQGGAMNRWEGTLSEH